MPKTILIDEVLTKLLQKYFIVPHGTKLLNDYYTLCTQLETENSWKRNDWEKELSFFAIPRISDRWWITGRFSLVLELCVCVVRGSNFVID